MENHDGVLIGAQKLSPTRVLAATLGSPILRPPIPCVSRMALWQGPVMPSQPQGYEKEVVPAKALGDPPLTGLGSRDHHEPISVVGDGRH